LLNTIIRIQRYEEVGFAILRTKARGIVFRVRGNFERTARFYLLGPLPNKIDDLPISVR
jgi:hypothetical protein